MGDCTSIDRSAGPAGSALRLAALGQRLGPRGAACGTDEEVAQFGAQAFGQPIHDIDAGVPKFTLDQAEIGPVDAGIDGQMLLRHATLCTQPPQIPSQKRPPVHAAHANWLKTIKTPYIVDILEARGRAMTLGDELYSDLEAGAGAAP